MTGSQALHGAVEFTQQPETRISSVPEFMQINTFREDNFVPCKSLDWTSFGPSTQEVSQCISGAAPFSSNGLPALWPSFPAAPVRHGRVFGTNKKP